MTTIATEHDAAVRYLAAGRLTVQQAGRHGVVATVRSDSGLLYRAEWAADTGWHCNCPAHGNQCAHLLALRQVTDVDDEVTS